MTAPFSTRRRADEFEALLSRGPNEPPGEREAARFADLLDVVADLRALPDVAPRPEFVSSLRERLMAEADTVLVRQPPAPSRLAMPGTARKRDRRVAAALGGAALVGAAATMAVAAQTALPGESLYDVKRGIEAAEVRFATDDGARGHLLLEQADTRLGEVEALASGDDGRDQLIPDTIDSFTRQSSDGVRSLLASYRTTGSDRDAQAAREFTTRSLERLDALESQVPDSARDELLAAGRTLTDLDLEVTSQCAACPGGITEAPEFLLSGAPEDLVSALDPDDLALEGAPVSGQDLTGIEVPEALAPQQGLPTRPPSTTLVPSPPAPATPSLPDPTRTDPVKPQPTSPVKDPTQNVPSTVTNTTSDLASQLHGITGGALGGLTSGVDDATGGLIGEVTGSLDGATDGTLHDATGGLLP